MFCAFAMKKFEPAYVEGFKSPAFNPFLHFPADVYINAIIDDTDVLPLRVSIISHATVRIFIYVCFVVEYPLSWQRICHLRKEGIRIAAREKDGILFKRIRVLSAFYRNVSGR